MFITAMDKYGSRLLSSCGRRIPSAPALLLVDSYASYQLWKVLCCFGRYCSPLPNVKSALVTSQFDVCSALYVEMFEKGVILLISKPFGFSKTDAVVLFYSLETPLYGFTLNTDQTSQLVGNGNTQLLASVGHKEYIELMLEDLVLFSFLVHFKVLICAICHRNSLQHFEACS